MTETTGKMEENAVSIRLTEQDAMKNYRDNMYSANRVVWITGEIDQEIQQDVMKWLHFYNDGSKKPVTVYINSFGGDLYTMFAILDLLESLKVNGITVNTVCLGCAMSAAAVLFACGSKGHRYVTRNSVIMIHSAQNYVNDRQCKTKDVSLQAKWMERLQNTMEGVLAKVTSKTITEIRKIVEYETYLTANEAVKFGIADNVKTFVA